MKTMAEHEHSFALLDYYRIREAAAEYCLSPEGKSSFLLSLPLVDPEALARLKGDIGFFLRRLEEGYAPAQEFPDIDSAVRKLAVEGASLALEEFYALGIWARRADSLIQANAASLSRGEKVVQPSESLEGFLHPGIHSHAAAAEAEEDESRPSMGFQPEETARRWADWTIPEILGSAPSLQDVQKIIFSILSPEGELRDLPELRRLKDAIAKANRDLGAIADSYRSDPEIRAALQSSEATQRDGRTVLAVRANFKGRVKGIVHEVSSTGQTVFIEPAALVEKNNELVQLAARLNAEIMRILREATLELRSLRWRIRAARISVALVDLRLARALQIRREERILAETCESGLTLWRARHPLLGRKAVPIDVAVPDGIRTLIVTGPNTGGKTVTLKTLGLFALMHQSALGLPAAQGTKFQVFDAVFADIGDEQSIDQSLSTFSGHMKVISDVAAKAGSSSLVLLDELGAGTDPEEGCAIAMGLLDHFIALGSLTIATTHHGILKNYGYTREACLNASMEFDSTRLAPTYRIVMGVPGESRALEIASQTGLDGRIVAAARKYLDEERTDVGELIVSLSEKHRELEKLERERLKRLKEAAEDQRKADLAALRVRQKELELKRHGVGELRQLLAESRKTLENLVKELRESGADGVNVKEVKSFLSQLAQSADSERESLERQDTDFKEAARRMESPGPDPVAPTGKRNAKGKTASSVESFFREGAEVLILSTGKKGRLLRKMGGRRWSVEIGSVRMTMPEEDLRPFGMPKAEAPRYDVELKAGAGEGGPRAAFELDLRGYRLQEALSAVESQIDAASLSGLTLFSIIHGTGEGILGAGIHGYLKENPAVEDYHFARPEEGGYGKTVVRLKN